MHHHSKSRRTTIIERDTHLSAEELSVQLESMSEPCGIKIAEDLSVRQVLQIIDVLPYNSYIVFEHPVSEKNIALYASRLKIKRAIHFHDVPEWMIYHAMKNLQYGKIVYVSQHSHSKNLLMEVCPSPYGQLLYLNPCINLELACQILNDFKDSAFLIDKNVRADYAKELIFAATDEQLLVLHPQMNETLALNLARQFPEHKKLLLLAQMPHYLSYKIASCLPSTTDLYFDHAMDVGLIWQVLLFRARAQLHFIDLQTGEKSSLCQMDLIKDGAIKFESGTMPDLMLAILAQMPLGFSLILSSEMPERNRTLILESLSDQASIWIFSGFELEDLIQICSLLKPGQDVFLSSDYYHLAYSKLFEAIPAGVVLRLDEYLQNIESADSYSAEQTFAQRAVQEDFSALISCIATDVVLYLSNSLSHVVLKHILQSLDISHRMVLELSAQTGEVCKYLPLNARLELNGLSNLDWVIHALSHLKPGQIILMNEAYTEHHIETLLRAIPKGVIIGLTESSSRTVLCDLAQCLDSGQVLGIDPDITYAVLDTVLQKIRPGVVLYLDKRLSSHKIAYIIEHFPAENYLSISDSMSLDIQEQIGHVLDKKYQDLPLSEMSLFASHSVELLSCPDSIYNI